MRSPIALVLALLPSPALAQGGILAVEAVCDGGAGNQFAYALLAREKHEIRSGDVAGSQALLAAHIRDTLESYRAASRSSAPARELRA